MLVYLIPLFLLSLLSCLENKIKYHLFVKNKYFYLLILTFFIFFIGFRNHSGCDWDAYLTNFDQVSSTSWESFTIKSKLGFFDIGYSAISKLISYKFDFNILIFIISSFFTIPLFIFCYQLKRTYLSLLISYPYFIVVIGMGPLRQSGAIGFLMLSIIFLLNNKSTLFYLFSFLSGLLHSSAIIFTSLDFINLRNLNNKKYENIFRIIFIFLIFLLIIYNFDWVYSKIYVYFFNYKGMSKAKSAIFIWLINFIPMTLYITNISKFNFDRKVYKIILFFFSYELFFFFILFINNILAYRFLLYCFPITIYITSHLPDVKIFNVKKDYIIYFIMSLSIFNLIFWMKYANHSYCWLPYHNLLFN